MLDSHEPPVGCQGWPGSARPFAPAAESDGERLPDRFLLDLNIPKKDGRHVLSEIRTDPRLRQIPVVILTTSQSRDDIAGTYGLGADAYMPKPVNLDQFLDDVRAAEAYWLTRVMLPRE